MSESNFAGAPPTAESQGTRKQTSGQSRRLRNQMREGSNGWAIRTDTGGGRCHPPDL